MLEGGLLYKCTWLIRSYFSNYNLVRSKTNDMSNCGKAEDIQNIYYKYFPWKSTKIFYGGFYSTLTRLMFGENWFKKCF